MPFPNTELIMYSSFKILVNDETIKTHLNVVQTEEKTTRPFKKCKLSEHLSSCELNKKTHLLLELHSFKNAVHIFNGKCEIVKASIASKKKSWIPRPFQKVALNPRNSKGKIRCFACLFPPHAARIAF